MCIIDCLSTIVFILPLHLDYTKVIILILWWRNFQLEYWRTFQLVSTTLHGSNSTITANFKQPIRSITINLDRFYSSTSSINGGRSYEYLTVSSTDCSGIICKIYGQTKNDMDNMDEVGYPVRIEQNQKVMYAYLEWETVTQDGDTREKSVTPQSFDIIIDNVMVLSNIKSPSGKQSLDFGEFDGKEITGIGYRITFQFTSHWE